MATSVEIRAGFVLRPDEMIFSGRSLVLIAHNEYNYLVVWEYGVHLFTLRR